MKKIFSLLITLCSLAAFGQYPVNSISIKMPANPPANTADWATAMPPIMITAQAKLVQGQVPGNLMESRMLVTIKSSRICGSYTQQTAPLSNFNSATKTWSGAVALGFLGNSCILQPGTYELCVQFFSSYAPVMPLSNEVCKTFTIADNKQITYSHPQNLAPSADKNFTKQEVKQPILFRWTQVNPPTPNNVLFYTFHFYAVGKGQSPAQAARLNTPVYEKEVNITQAIWQLPLEFTSSKETLTFVWNVQAKDNKNKPYGADQGISEPTVFHIINNNQGKDTINDRKPVIDTPRLNLTTADCKNFKVQLTKVFNRGINSYQFIITNSYLASDTTYRPKIFRITSNNSSIISATGVAEGWDRIPPAVPPNTNNITWKITSGYIPIGQTILGNISFGNIRINPFYLTYEWLDIKGKVICKDSVLVNIRL